MVSDKDRLRLSPEQLDRAAREERQRDAAAYITRTQPDADQLLEALGLVPTPAPRRRPRRRPAAQ